MGERPPRLTAVRRARPGRVELEVDGKRWRMVPDAVVLRCGLAPGVELDRPLLRSLRRELRAAEALGLALRAVSRQELSTRRLHDRLAARGVRSGPAEGAVARLTSAGVVDDARAAGSRARALAERGWGDAAVATRLAREGFAADDVREALAGLRPERDRAADLAATAADPPAAWKLLARRGFAPETLEDVVGLLDAGR
jgi:SOS response regulatory protein OraA/RecX